MLIEKKIRNYAILVDRFLNNYFNKHLKSQLAQIMKYSTLKSGKKIRSAIIFALGNIYKVEKKKLIYLCAAVECMHSYSLVHDDLPCMDNDLIRRGKPATHVKFGEANAILAGNSLLTLAFQIITDKDLDISEIQKSILVNKLAKCSGSEGIAGGQYLDLKYENTKVKMSNIIEMEIKKTGKLFNFCCLSVGVLKKKKNQDLKLLEQLGDDIGLLFQIADDRLDILGKSSKTGKAIKKDKKKGKSNIVVNLGIEKSNQYVLLLENKILKKIKKIGGNNKDLINLVKFIINRNF